MKKEESLAGVVEMPATIDGRAPRDIRLCPIHRRIGARELSRDGRQGPRIGLQGFDNRFRQLEFFWRRHYA